MWRVRNITTSGKTLPTIVLLIVPSIVILGEYLLIPTPIDIGAIVWYPGLSGCILLALPYVTVVYIFYPSGRKYFKKGEYQKGIDEFEYIRQILLVEIPLLFAVILLSYLPQTNGNYLIDVTLGQVGVQLIWIVISGLLRIGLLIVRKEFRFYFAKGCFNIIPHNEEFDQMRCLRLGLDSYNKYLRRRVKYQISDNIIKQFYSKYIRATSQERNEMINSLLQAFEEGRTIDR